MREELDRLGERIAEQAAHIDAAMHRVLTDIRAFDEAKGYALQGFASCAHWLSWRVGWTPGIARERVRVARRLGALPAIDDELRRGAVSFSKVRAMTRVAEPAIEHALIEYARHATAAQLETIVRKYQTVQDAAKQDPAQRAARRRLAKRTLDDGMVRIEAVVRPEEAALIWAAIERAAADVPAATPDLVDGLVAIAQDYARGGATERVPVELVVTVPFASIAGISDEPGELAGGTFVSAATARRLACDAGLVTISEDADGNVLSVGQKTRSIPSAIKRALRHRDKTCRFPGCTNRRFVEGHHVQHWADGGATSLENIVTLCTSCHVRVHEHGCRVELGADGEPRFFDARGRRIEPVPPRPTPGDIGLPALRAQNRGLDITAMTGACRWDGRQPDYSAAIDGLLAVATRGGEDDERDDDVERRAQDDYLAELLARSAARSSMP